MMMKRGVRLHLVVLLAATATLGGCYDSPFGNATEKEERCAEVYMDYMDIDDCLGQDKYLRKDGTYKKDSTHCDILAPEDLKTDVRCKGYRAE